MTVLVEPHVEAVQVLDEAHFVSDKAEYRAFLTRYDRPGGWDRYFILTEENPKCLGPGRKSHQVCDWLYEAEVKFDKVVNGYLRRGYRENSEDIGKLPQYLPEGGVLAQDCLPAAREQARNLNLLACMNMLTVPDLMRVALQRFEDLLPDSEHDEELARARNLVLADLAMALPEFTQDAVEIYQHEGLTRREAQLSQPLKAAIASSGTLPVNWFLLMLTLYA